MALETNPIGRFMIGAGCVLEHEPSGLILCLRRERSDYLKGNWELTYGRIGQHEDIMEGFRREMREELGLQDIEVRRLLRLWHFYRGETHDEETEIHGCTFHCVTQSREITLSSEHSEYRWIPAEEALDLITIPGVREDVRFFIENRDNKKIALSGVENKITEVIG